MGAYSRWALIRGWALIRINTVKKNYKPKANDKAKKTTLFFSKPGRVCNKVKTKYRRAVHRMSSKTFQAPQRILLKFNRELDKKPREISEEG